MNTTTQAQEAGTTASNTSISSGNGVSTLLGALAARWPSAVGMLVLIANSAGGVDPHVAAMIIILAAMCYLAAAALGSRRSSWVVLWAAVAAVTVAQATAIDPTTMLLVAGVGFAVVGLLRGSRVDRGELGIQAAGFLGFSTVALIAMMVSPTAAAYLAAAAAIGHGIWDIVHHFRDQVVARSFTEFCAVLDVGLGVLLLLATWITL